MIKEYFDSLAKLAFFRKAVLFCEVFAKRSIVVSTLNELGGIFKCLMKKIFMI